MGFSTGVLDAETVELMMKPRCEVPNIINGLKTYHHRRRQGSFGESHYSFFAGNPKWPDSKGKLTFGFSKRFPANFIPVVGAVFETWSHQSHFQFSQGSYESADLRFDFKGINGPGNTLGYASAPTNGHATFDDTESWTLGVSPGKMSFFPVALHEIGHLLGLNHSFIEAAIMYPWIPLGKTKGLDDDDIGGIRALYPYVGALGGL